MSTQFAFVSVEGAKGKVKKEDRELVRSRCMKGKNKKEDSRRSLREARARQAMVLPQRPRQQWPSGNAHPGGYIGEAASSMGNGEDGDQEDFPTMKKTGQNSWKITVGASLHREMVRFMHEDTPAYPREMAFTSQTLVNMKASNYPVYGYLEFCDKVLTPPLHWLLTDRLFRHAVLYNVAVFKSCIQRQPLSEATLKHHQVTLNLLNQKLSDPTQSPVNRTTIWAMTLLANTAHGLARHDEVAMHARAIRRICDVYGGKDYIAQRPTLRYNIYALELASSVGNGTNNVQGLDSIPHIPESRVIEDEMPPWSLPLANRTVLASMGMTIDGRVISVFRTLQELNHRLGERGAKGERLDADTFQAFTYSASSRLLRLKGSLPDISSECLRLGLLSFMTLSSFRVMETRYGPGRDSTLYPYLTHSFRTALLAVDFASDQLSSLMLWLLTIGAMSVFDIDKEHWLVEKWNETAQALPGVSLSWEAATEQLESVIWTKSLHNDMGFKVYQKFIKKTR